MPELWIISMALDPLNPFSTETVLLVGYWSPITNIPSFSLSYLYKTPVYVPNLSVNWVYQLTRYKLCPMKWSNTGNVQKIDDLMYLNPRRLQSSLGIQSMFLATTIVVASIEWVKQPLACISLLFVYIHVYIVSGLQRFYCTICVIAKCNPFFCLAFHNVLYQNYQSQAYLWHYCWDHNTRLT